METIRKAYTITDSTQEEIINRFQNDMRNGLGTTPSSIKMIPSFVTNRPNGTETGDYLALDLGGTNFRVVIYHFHGDGKCDETEKKYRIPVEIMNGDAIGLFDFIANCVLDMKPPEVLLGFTFSFPVDQTSICDGILVHWTKGFNATGCVGKNPTTLLNDAFVRKNSKIRVAALANDTVGTLMAKCYEKKNCLVGVILGTGYNCAYVELANNIPKWNGKKEGEMIINMECGGFGKLEDIQTIDDKILDKKSINPGEQLNEKMISGMYLGELSRVVMQPLVQQKLLFKDATIQSDSLFHKEMSLETPKLSEIEADETADLTKTEAVLKEIGIENSSISDRKIVKEITTLMSTRSAILAACNIAGICRFIGDRSIGCTVGIDGSLYKLYPHYHDRLLAALRHLGCDASIEISEDGSGKGAALIAVSTVP